MHERLPETAALRELVRATASEVLCQPGCAARDTKRDGSVVTGADLRIQRLLEQRLVARWPAYPVLGEEMTRAVQRQVLREHGAAYWCLDPVDGTTNFATGLPFYSVSLALVVGGRSVLGLVLDPVRGECFTAVAGAGAELDGRTLPAQPEVPLADCVAAVDFKRLSASMASRLAVEPPYRSQRNLGSAALEWCWLAAGRFQVSVHGCQKLWDCAAGALILTEMGGMATTFEGDDLLEARLAHRSVVAAANPVVFRRWRDWLGT